MIDILIIFIYVRRLDIIEKKFFNVFGVKFY